ncbi:ketopantoate reductase family protein [Halomonas urumqiensis]|uniref:2-dehydropantoate 2-reductase n=1 Tax=Halomonas urumqiensis TaxID=1684789 RepID=A0A2N7UQZ1_9GAMM|nr:2-dehydropantoate 2-reductase [Halomonas urumqiensis]PMR82845.1 2-dehydropantoate 2-reductase [Halomonas urumqiensis]PTB01837.1 2-dehydropantoate 2-reductase [Halomonas urumqiensis]GHE21938.1 2-dehydropantoate 2-reductase [Halomonas urumqiensis]
MTRSNRHQRPGAGAAHPSVHHWIVGPGALGRMLAMHLATAHAPHDTVTLVGRRAMPGQQRLITPHGQTLSATLATASLESLPAEPADVIHLTTKAYACEAALGAIAERLTATTPLVLWQNGFDCQPRITARHPGPVLCATTTEGAHVQDDSQVTHAGHGKTFLGDLDGRHSALATALAKHVNAAGLACEAVADIRIRLWRKLAVNAAINPLVAQFQIRNGQLRDTPYRGMVEVVIEELAPILASERITPPTGTGVQGWSELVWEVAASTANNRASMLQDVLAGRPTEHRAILGPLLDSAQRHGLQAPTLSSLYARLRELPANARI